jgi:hypothetical protein
MNWLANLIPLLVDAACRIADTVARRRREREIIEDANGVDLRGDVVYVDSELQERLEALRNGK